MFKSVNNISNETVAGKKPASVSSRRPAAGNHAVVTASACCRGGGNGNSLEIVNQERFQQQLEGMMSQADSSDGGKSTSGIVPCTSLNSRSSPRGNGGTGPSGSGGSGKRNTPIVVCLRETIRSGSTGSIRRTAKPHSFTASSGAANRRPASLSESNSSVADVSVQTVISLAHDLSQHRDYGSKTSSKCCNSRRSELVSRRRRERERERHLLNNSVRYDDEDGGATSRRNIELIRNDLRQTSSSVSSTDDAASSSSPPTSTFTSESDSDNTTTASASSSASATQHCHKCLAASHPYTHYYALGSKYFKIEVCIVYMSPCSL